MEEMEEKGDTKRKMELFPQALTLLQAPQKFVLRASTLPKMVSPRESRRNRFNFARSV